MSRGAAGSQESVKSLDPPNSNPLRSMPSGWAASAQVSPMTPTSSFFISPIYQLATSSNRAVIVRP